ncbi:uncharacterized oxidoreductase At4g09670 [Physcomitrium patens]|uniref:Gfo/Idh/MocA-like oxidoreductase N-terminal domain-containing protein n=1 Tax=Physcomitrium patens TaxID=3218 RepID=A9RHY9_PHYPA|nr:uncharacterized oxidoreductase At4g09670-like [Physcomitrium patens]XP_024362958.1 uncharacterized oxidoreductase At4g09670-like [Physcomitrium patens]XP_024362959.1 uncharacterized oxidoreductase At4g09670-like [Physcomitrium patens]XP_024362961.1 uncharacterized oxidoreductase At4g09670-like [Physcomitrium patens]XP_024362962.1 uncharacterized oxidoreductase At4g09670-like [Physcomitrium patens]XP_024362963.1 uncharacterized oxidoreductase At4g09670-like [Physcomitrium patens]XP_02436296|eukprot:XP_024362957.1 uncharacterized oxidoreductase At4g09670-like [Physcomitrella patens]
MAHEIKFGILGCANIARCLVRSMKLLPEVKIYAIASRTLAKAQSFAAENELPEETKVYGSYDELVEDEEVDALYIPLPTAFHVEWVLKAAAKKKHVLLEKPPARTVEELKVMVEALDKNGLQYMDGTMWMHHPRTRKMEAVLHDSSRLGRILEVHATFNYHAEVAYNSIGGLTADVRGNPDLDGLGALGDIGWYCARGILWAYDYEMPASVTAHPGASYNEKGVIVSCGATLVWPDGRTATFTTSFNTSHVMKLLVVGETGSLESDDFTLPASNVKSSFKVVSNTSWKDKLAGWHRTEDFQEVTLEIPQEAHMIREFARLVANIRNGTGAVEPKWSEISVKTQMVLNAVKQSIENGLKTINL